MQTEEDLQIFTDHGNCSGTIIELQKSLDSIHKNVDICRKLVHCIDSESLVCRRTGQILKRAIASSLDDISNVYTDIFTCYERCLAGLECDIGTVRERLLHFSQLVKNFQRKVGVELKSSKDDSTSDYPEWLYKALGCARNWERTISCQYELWNEKNSLARRLDKSTDQFTYADSTSVTAALY